MSINVPEFLIYIVSASGIIGIFAKYFISKASESKIRIESLQLGVQALLRDRLLSIYNNYKDEEVVPYQVLDNFTNIYKNYHNLGANGVMDTIYEEMKNKEITISDKSK